MIPLIRSRDRIIIAHNPLKVHSSSSFSSSLKNKQDPFFALRRFYLFVFCVSDTGHEKIHFPLSLTPPNLNSFRHRLFSYRRTSFLFTPNLHHRDRVLTTTDKRWYFGRVCKIVSVAFRRTTFGQSHVFPCINNSPQPRQDSWFSSQFRQPHRSSLPRLHNTVLSRRCCL